MLVWILVALISLLGLVLLRYHIAVRNLSQQIREKRETGSQIRLTPQYHGQTSMIFFQEIHKTEEISFKISSFTKKFCQSDFLAFILYFFIN